MYLIVGLQNPGPAYARTRHNIGADAVHAFQEKYRLPAFVDSGQYAAAFTKGQIGTEEVLVLLPNTFMNKSGTAVRKAREKIGKAAPLIVVYDDLDLPVGSYKISYGRSSGGHNGVESVIQAIGSNDFVRVRIGISPVSLFGSLRRPRGDRVSDFVLRSFSRRERAKIDAVLPDVVHALELIVTKGKERAMEVCNRT